MKKTNWLKAAIISLVGIMASDAYADNSVELMAGNKSATLDLKVSAELAPKLGLFLRGKTNADYENNVSYFGLADLSYNLVEGLDAVAEAQAAPEMGVVPRLGVQYFKGIGDFSIYGLGTVAALRDTNGEVLLNVEYNPALTEKLKLVLNAECITNFAKAHNFSTQSLRAGLGISKFEFGAAADLAEADKLDYNIGGFVKVNF